MAKIIRRAIPIGAIDEFITPPLVVNHLKLTLFTQAGELRNFTVRSVPSGYLELVCI